MDITGALNSFLPTLSYIINLFDRLFTIFTAYLGFDLDEIYKDYKENDETCPTEAAE